MRSWQATIVFAERGRKLKVACGRRCFLCGKRRALARLQWAHTKPTGLCSRGRGAKHRYYDLLRNPDCYILACVWCHRRLDSSPRLRQELLTAEKVEIFLLTFAVARRIVCSSRRTRACRNSSKEGAAA